jgi:hypothetical protein
MQPAHKENKLLFDPTSYIYGKKYNAYALPEKLNFNLV